ncbi:DNA-directed RNA polymerase I subunit RPA34 [Pelodytes ibericus]
MESSGDKCQFQCPLNFEQVAQYDGRGISETDTEVWLIKAPADFNPESFNSHRLPLSGYKTQKVKLDGVRRLYHSSASLYTDIPCRAFLSRDENSEEKMTCAPAFQGILTIADGHADTKTLHAISDRPPLTIPQDLKLRYCPFGAEAPTQGQQSDGQLTDEPRKKKKKKAKKRNREVSGV